MSKKRTFKQDSVRNWSRGARCGVVNYDFDFKCQTASTTHHPRGMTVERSRHQGIRLLPTSWTMEWGTFWQASTDFEVSPKEGWCSGGSNGASTPSSRSGSASQPRLVVDTPVLCAKPSRGGRSRSSVCPTRSVAQTHQKQPRGETPTEFQAATSSHGMGVRSWWREADASAPYTLSELPLEGYGLRVPSCYVKSPYGGSDPGGGNTGFGTVCLFMTPPGVDCVEDQV